MRSAACETDHQLIRACIQLKPRRYIQKKKPTTWYDSRCLKNETIRRNFEESLVKNRPSPTNQVESIWNDMKHTLNKTAAETMEKKKPKTSDWFDESDEAIKKLLEEKTRAHKMYLSAPTQDNKMKYTNIKSKCQREVRKLQEKWWSEYALQPTTTTIHK